MILKFMNLVNIAWIWFFVEKLFTCYKKILHKYNIVQNIKIYFEREMKGGEFDEITATPQFFTAL